MTTRSLFFRSLLAIALLVGFYLLALGLAGALLALPVAEVALAGRLHIKLAILCLVGAGIILWSVMPRVDRFEPPGPLLEKADQPELFAVIEDVAQQTGQEMPAEVYLVPDLNAFVTERGGVMGFGSRRVMGLGLPLMQVLDVGQLRAVIAHELGHFHGGDTRLGPWIHKTRSALLRTVQNLGNSGSAFLDLLQLPFQAYLKVFLGLTLAVSRAQEYAADRLAALTQGARPLREGLQVIHSAGMAYQAYFRSQVAPALEAGFRPPYADGFSRFVGQDRIREILDDALAEALATSETDRWDTHPALKDRLAAIEDTQETDAPPDGDAQDRRPATALRADLSSAEGTLLASMFQDPDRGARLEPVSWDEVGERVYLPTWRKLVEAHAEVLQTVDWAAPPTTQADLVALARQALGDRAEGGSDEDLGGFARELLGCALAVELADRDWAIDAGPGHPIRCRQGDQQVRPFRLVEHLESGELDGQDWRAQAQAAGLGG